MSFPEYAKKHIIAILIGVLGFLSAIITMFINVDNTISIKWLIFTIFITLVIILLLVNFSLELAKESFKNENINRLKLRSLSKETDKGEVFLNKSLIDFDYGDVVKIYYLDKSKIEQFIGIGIIEHIQKEQNICHIKFIWKKENLAEIKDVYFSLKINKDELQSLLDKEY